MPTYFFDIFGDRGDVNDEDGVDLPDVASARVEALLSAREQIADAAKAGRDITHLRFRVRDGSGATLFTLPFCETITRS